MKLKKLVNNPFVKECVKFFFRFLTDDQVINIQYKTVLKRKPDLKNPERFTEKLQWYKLNYRIPLMTKCADKYLVREYIQEKGFGDTLVKLYQVCESFEEIDFKKLPNSFVIKSNKGSGTNLFIKDKNSIDNNQISRSIKSWNTVNTVLMGREWAYKDIKDKIVVEELLIDKKNSNREINDYKFLCFNGEVKYIWVDTDRHIEHKRNFYDIKWNLLNIESDCPISNNDIEKPGGFDYMMRIAESIANDFPFVRVDFYWVNNKVYFGEITFYPWSGCVQFNPDNFDYELGGHFRLPNPTI